MSDQSGKLEIAVRLLIFYEMLQVNLQLAFKLNITALNNNSYWIWLSFDVKLEKARLLCDYMFEQLRPEFLSIFLSYLNLVINPSGV